MFLDWNTMDPLVLVEAGESPHQLRKSEEIDDKWCWPVMGQNDWTPVFMVSDPKDDHAICQMPNGCPKENGPIGRYALFMVFVWAILR